MRRREALGLLGASVLSACSKERVAEPAPAARERTPTAAAMPAIFAAHGAPTLLDDASWMGELATWAKALPRPAAVLIISAHWHEQPVTLGATSTLPLVYDFSGFAPRFYQTQYRAPGAPQLAARVRELLRSRQLPFADAPQRGLDHGAYVPLVAMYPAADLPVLQLSLPGLQPAQAFELGAALSPLRREGVLVFGSGFLTHNMRYAFRRGVPGWASEFDAWAAEALVRFDVDALVDFRARAPGAALALPTWEHYTPLLVTAGAFGEGTPQVAFPITGFWQDGAFTRRSVQLT